MVVRWTVVWTCVLASLFMCASDTGLTTDTSTWVDKPNTVVDAYAKWAGPCEPMQNIFKRLKIDYGDEITFIQNGVLVKIVRGANAPMIEKTIKEQLEIEKSGQPHQQIIYDDKGNLILSGPLHHQDAPSVPITSPSDTSPITDSETPASAAAAAESPSSPDTNIQDTLAIIKPDAMCPSILSNILYTLHTSSFKITNHKKTWLSAYHVSKLYSSHTDKPYYNSLVSYLTSSPILALVLRKHDAVSEWRKMMGPSSSTDAKRVAPDSIRAVYGTDARINAVHGSSSSETAAHEINIFFPSSEAPQDADPALALPSYPTDDIDITSPNPMQPDLQKTLALIYPDAVAAGHTDTIIDRILCHGYRIVKREELMLNGDQVAALFKSHASSSDGSESASEPTTDGEKNPSLSDITTFMTSGPVVALVLTGDNVISGWLTMIGPADPATAKQTSPNSIRAIHGASVLHASVYGSISPDTSVHDITTVFPYILSRSGSGVFASRPGTASNPYPPGYRESVVQHFARLERTYGMIKPDAHPLHTKDIITRIKVAGFTIIAEREHHFSLPQAQDFYKEHVDKPFFNDLVTWITNHPIYALVLEKENAVGEWRSFIGPTNSVKAKEIAPESIRALYGTDGSHNAVHGSDSPISAEREIQIVFGDTVSSVPDPLQTTLALIKPDAHPQHTDDILQKIKAAGFDILKQKELTMIREQAQEFYKEHVGKSFFDELVGWITGSPIYAMVLQKQGAVAAWRRLIGPTNSVTARDMNPESIRALYGTDGSHNAVHGSDSPDSSKREIGVLFGVEYANSLDLPVETYHAHLVHAGEPVSDVAPVAHEHPPAETNENSESKQNLARHQSVPSVTNNPEPSTSHTGSRANLAKSTSQARVTGSSINLANRPSSRSGLTGSAGSKANVSGSKANISGSKANISGSKVNISGSKANIAGSKANLIGSKANLTGSKTNLTGSKANLDQKAPSNPSVQQEPQQQGSKTNLEAITETPK